MFTTLTIKEFRGFAELELKDLKRINLVVGRNNAGKTSLLEALVLVASPDPAPQLLPLLRPQRAQRGGPPPPSAFRWLFRSQSEDAVAEIAATFEERVFSVRCRQQTQQRGKTILGTANSRIINAGGLEIIADQHQPTLKCQIVAVQHHSPEKLVQIFGKAVRRKGGEERIEALLREVDPRVIKVRLYPGAPFLDIVVDIGLPEALPISEVGQGMYRLLAIFSELIGEDPKVLIIDEIENGIHHSMLQQVWTGIAAAAEALNVQVFATTHSGECIEAAHAAFAKRPLYDFSIVQLFRLEQGTGGRVLDREHIEAAIAGEIDLR